MKNTNLKKLLLILNLNVHNFGMEATEEERKAEEEMMESLRVTSMIKESKNKLLEKHKEFKDIIGLLQMAYFMNFNDEKKQRICNYIRTIQNILNHEISTNLHKDWKFLDFQNHILKNNNHRLKLVTMAIEEFENLLKKVKNETEETLLESIKEIIEKIQKLNEEKDEEKEIKDSNLDNFRMKKTEEERKAETIKKQMEEYSKILKETIDKLNKEMINLITFIDLFKKNCLSECKENICYINIIENTLKQELSNSEKAREAFATQLCIDFSKLKNSFFAAEQQTKHTLELIKMTLEEFKVLLEKKIENETEEIFLKSVEQTTTKILKQSLNKNDKVFLELIKKITKETKNEIELNKEEEQYEIM